MNRLTALAMVSWLGFSPAAQAASLQVVGSLARDASLAPGESTSGEIVVRNASDEPLRARVYAQDYRFSADGSNEFLEPGTLPRSNAAWVRFTPEEIVLPPGGTTAVAYTMTAPEGALPGTWWSTLMIEPSPDPVAVSAAPGVSVRTVIRYAVHLVTEIGRPEADLAFAGVRLTHAGSTATLHVDVANPGTRLLVPGLSVQVHGEDGASVGTFRAEPARIYPGCSVGYRVPLEGLPAGRYESLIVADAGEEVLFGARASLDLTALAPVVSRAP